LATYTHLTCFATEFRGSSNALADFLQYLG
jgi:hypothetical protein